MQRVIKLLGVSVVACSVLPGLFASTLIVSNTNDSGTGSLRGAVTAATSGDTIDATGISGSIVLTNGELVLNKNLTILGPGPNLLSIDGNYPSKTNRVININSTANSSLTVTVFGVTITNGHTTGTAFGGGIQSRRTILTLSNCTFAGNFGFSGGGIYSEGTAGPATLTMSNCTLSANTASGFGGGVYINSTTGGTRLTIHASTFRGNSADSGGALCNAGGSGGATGTVTACTFIGNSAFNAGAVYNLVNSFGSATLMIVASTLSSNSADGSGGGIYNDGSAGIVTLTVKSSTLADNSASQGGGILTFAAPLEIGNTILKAGSSGATISNLGAAVTSLGYNLSSDKGGGVLTNATDQINTNPLLAPLANNGGPTLTHALLPGSSAIDQGNSFGLTTDQRGLPRPNDQACLANASGGDGSDIGAFEAQESCSDFRLTGMTRESNNIRISWVTLAGKSNFVERTAGVAGSFSNNFTSITNIFTTGTSTNYLDLNAATNTPAFYYRVRLVP